MSFIAIIPEDEVFDWSYTEPDTGRVYDDTVLQLRQLPMKERRRLEKKHTTRKRIRGTMQSDLDAEAFSADILDHCIVGWSGVCLSKRGKDGRRERVEIPCTRENKLLLPEQMKIEIGRICIGRSGNDILDTDANAAAEDGEEAPLDASAPASPGTSTG